jgi:3-oxoacyl-[acyl-carrier-protein] synthase-3
VNAPRPLSSRVWIDRRGIKVLGTGVAFPGPSVATDELLEWIDYRFGISIARLGSMVAKRLDIRTRHICRDFADRIEPPRAGHSNPELAAAAIRQALSEANLSVHDLSYLIGHTATPAQPVPPNIAQVAELLGYDGPFVEIRQACAGFANALVMANGLLSAPDAGPVAIVGSETGSVFFDPLRAAQDHGQLVNLIQMGDGAGAIVLASDDGRPGARLSRIFYGQIGRNRSAGLKMPCGGSAAPTPTHAVLEFEHDIGAIRRFGLELLVEAMKAARNASIKTHNADWVIPHQANGRMDTILGPLLGLRREQIFVNADRIGNTGSAAIWLALAELRQRMKAGQTVLTLGAEATKYMFGGFQYVHG